MFTNKQFPFWVLAFSIGVVLTVPTLIKEGMFMDAMLYTSVSHNLSMGIGTFWFPQFSVHNLAGLSSFHEQPPLVFGIQALFFALLGDSLYVERLYTFLTFCITAWLIHILWKTVFTNDQSVKKIAWLPLILWITIPVCFWSYSNNMHENTMGIFTLLAVLFAWKACKKEKGIYLIAITSGVFVFLASMSKGLPGFFPIMLPVLFWVAFKENSLRHTLKISLIVGIIPVLFYGVLFLFPESKESLYLYFFKRALQRINEVPTVESRFYVLFRLFSELLAQLIITVIVILIAKKNKTVPFYGKYYKEAIFFALVGLSASAPLMLTLVQKGFYFVPALPFFAISLASLIAPSVSNWVEKINTGSKAYTFFTGAGIALFFTVIVFSCMQVGKFSRNKEMLHDIYLFGKIIPKYEVVSIGNNIWNDWDLQCNLIRYFNISVESSFNKEFFILPKQYTPPEEMKPYKKLNISSQQYDLYKKSIKM